MFPHLPTFLQHGCSSHLGALKPQNRKKGGRSQAPLTGLSHPGNAEAGEAEEHDSDERDEQVHVPGPHGADSTAAAPHTLARTAVHTATTPPPAKDGHALCLPPGARAAAPLPGVARNLAPPTPTHPPHTHPAPFPQQQFWPSILNRLPGLLIFK